VWKRRTKTSALVLFVLGILLAVGAFLGDKADSLPFILSLLSPKYTEAQSGLTGLGNKMTLSSGDQGFRILANMFLSRIEEGDPPDRIADVTITKIERRRPTLVFGKRRAREVVKVTFSLSNGQSLDWTLAKLSEAVLALKAGRIFLFSASVLFVGILTQVVGFMMQVRETRHKLDTTS
jgi:hypothetical protein